MIGVERFTNQGAGGHVRVIPMEQKKQKCHKCGATDVKKTALPQLRYGRIYVLLECQACRHTWMEPKEQDGG